MAGALQVDTDHGAYDALPTREEDYGVAGAILTVFCEDGHCAGYVVPVEMETVYYLATDAAGEIIGPVYETEAGAVNAVAARDSGPGQ
jgi:hypothetical protein